MMKGKIHRATVTEADLHYVGSVSIDPDLMKAADIIRDEQVHVLDIDNGNRLVTYAIPVNYYGGPAGIRRLMRSWGADVWGADIYDDETIIHARKQQAQYIEIKLRECGIPFRGGLAVR